MIANKKVRGYNSLNSGCIFIPAKYVGLVAEVRIKIEKEEDENDKKEISDNIR